MPPSSSGLWELLSHSSLMFPLTGDACHHLHRGGLKFVCTVRTIREDFSISKLVSAYCIYSSWMKPVQCNTRKTLSFLSIMSQAKEKMPASQKFHIHTASKRTPCLTASCSAALRLPSQAESFKANQQNCEITRDKEAKSYFHSLSGGTPS